VSFYESFFKETVEMAKKIKPQIIGHFDLFTKYDENASTFPQTKEYIECALDTINTCIGYTEAFEVNTGAISRGYRKNPYPADFIIKHLKDKKIPIVLSSDAHSVSSIKQSFKETAQRLGALGVDSLYEYHKDGLCKINIR
jgi:histidinol-phosphatase (PHP family)